jgi:hypothetical protein
VVPGTFSSYYESFILRRVRASFSLWFCLREGEENELTLMMSPVSCSKKDARGRRLDIKVLASPVGGWSRSSRRKKMRLGKIFS